MADKGENKGGQNQPAPSQPSQGTTPTPAPQPTASADPKGIFTETSGNVRKFNQTSSDD